MTDREAVVKVLAETNQRYQVSVYHRGSTVVAAGSRKRAYPAKPTEFHFDVLGHFVSCGERGWRAIWDYPRVVLALWGFRRSR